MKESLHPFPNSGDPENQRLYPHYAVSRSWVMCDGSCTPDTFFILLGGVVKGYCRASFVFYCCVWGDITSCVVTMTGSEDRGHKTPIKHIFLEFT